MRRVRAVGVGRGRPLGEVSLTLLRSISAGSFSSTRELALVHQLSVRHAVKTVSNLRAAGYVHDREIQQHDGTVRRVLACTAESPQLQLPSLTFQFR